MIVIENVSLSHRDTPILSDIDLALPRGGTTVLVGPNGAGKWSLFSLIARLQPLQKGRITVDGMPVDTTSSRTLAQRLAILRQDGAVSSRFTVREIVDFGRFPHHQGRPAAEDLALVDAALCQFDLQSLADRFIDTLSGGQRQRTMVAMTLCQGTDYQWSHHCRRSYLDRNPTSSQRSRARGNPQVARRARGATARRCRRAD